MLCYVLFSNPLSKLKYFKITLATSRQCLDVITDPEVDVEPGCCGAVHEVGDPAALPAQVLAGVELGAVVWMRNQIVLRVLSHFGADLIVS
jgi:hypothetical protein